MGAPFEICSKRNAVAVLATGVVISLTALTGGLAPAYAKPDDEPVVPTTTVPVPEPELVIPEEPAEAEAPKPEAPKPEAPMPEAPQVEVPQVEVPQVEAPKVEAPKVEVPPSTAPAILPAPETVEAPETQATQTTEAPAPLVPQTQVTEPQTQTAQPPKPSVIPSETTAEAPAPRVAAPSATEPALATSTSKKPASAAPATPPAEPTTNGSATTSSSSVPPSAALVPPSEATAGESATTETETKTEAESTTAGVDSSESSTVSQVAQVIEPSEPQTLEAPKEDVEIAKSAKVVEVKPDPAPQQDVAALSSDLDLGLGIGGEDGINASASANAEVRLAADRRWDRNIRQWRPDWVEYDEYYRPVILNPFHERVRIVYIYQNAPRIVWIPPLARIVLEVAQFAAYSFTAVVATAANIVNAAVDTAVDVAVGTFFGGGYYPGFGLPLPPPPPPVLRYDNVPVLVRYSDRVYEPFRIRRIVDVGDDARFGERKVLLDGATPAWGVWTQTPTGERQFEVHRTQQFPGLDTPQEAPLPGDYRMVLASDDASPGLTARDIFLYVAAGVIATLGFGAIGLALWLGRRRPQH
jgi:chemotaxis protein histidine kinase CheA